MRYWCLAASHGRGSIRISVQKQAIFAYIDIYVKQHSNSYREKLHVRQLIGFRVKVVVCEDDNTDLELSDALLHVVFWFRIEAVALTNHLLANDLKAAFRV